MAGNPQKPVWDNFCNTHYLLCAWLVLFGPPKWQLLYEIFVEYLLSLRYVLYVLLLSYDYVDETLRRNVPKYHCGCIYIYIYLFICILYMYKYTCIQVVWCYWSLVGLGLQFCKPHPLHANQPYKVPCKMKGVLSPP